MLKNNLNVKAQDGGKQMAEKKLEIRMLGSFSLNYAGREIVIDRNAVSKTTQLLQILALHAEEGISKAGLMDALYGRDSVENRNGSLNNTIFRLRKQLKTAGLPDSQYICIQNGMCTWDEKIPLQVDVCAFQKLAEKSRLAEGQEQIDICRRAAACYTGEFLPNMIGEDWVTVENVRCRDLYAHCVQKLCEYNMGQEHYEEALQVAAAAASIYPFENWQLWQIDSLMAMSRYQEAMEIYEKTTKRVLDELGLPPSPEMLKRFRVMGEHVSQTAEVTEDIRKRLDEKDHVEGAYYCSFPGFVDIYHVFRRMMERNGKAAYIMLCTLKQGSSPEYPVRGDTESRSREASGKLAESIRSSLRRGDFYTRYSYTQYLILFSDIRMEHCKIVSDRIQKKFEQKTAGEYRVDFDVTAIEDTDKNEA